MIDFFETDKKFVKPLLLMNDDMKSMLFEIMKAYPKDFTLMGYEQIFNNLKFLHIITDESVPTSMVGDLMHTIKLTKFGREMCQWLTQ
jgi:hypothetical protein